MKTLSLYQPWATLVVIGAKRWETRSWKTSYRGPLLIHASKRFSRNEREVCEQCPFDEYVMPNLTLSHVPVLKSSGERLALGTIIGRVDLTDCITTEKWLEQNTQTRGQMARLVQSEIGVGELFLKQTSWKEYEFGDFSDGRYAWKLENPVKFDKPIPAKGSLGIWEFEESALGHLARES